MIKSLVCRFKTVAAPFGISRISITWKFQSELIDREWIQTELQKRFTVQLPLLSLRKQFCNDRFVGGLPLSHESQIGRLNSLSYLYSSHFGCRTFGWNYRPLSWTENFYNWNPFFYTVTWIFQFPRVTYTIWKIIQKSKSKNKKVRNSKNMSVFCGSNFI